ncbi:Mitochondrial citrate and oxoglutarate carrier protein / Mitochondrial DNA replication protein [Penicillium ucsense]|nr:Mitochondrial citrate and oxoglutarate carrier protein / Mitochondrial DNA replication protein [Penicillium ucsense]
MCPPFSANQRKFSVSRQPSLKPSHNCSQQPYENGGGLFWCFATAHFQYLPGKTSGSNITKSEIMLEIDYQGLIPWAWIEASTKGAVLLFVASEAEYQARSLGANQFVGGIAGGMVGGIAQAYATMGFCTCMKTVEITKHKMAAAGVKPPSTFATFMDIYRKEGIRGINRGVNAVAIRQTTNWGSRFGLSRLAESAIRKVTGKDDTQKLSAWEKVLASGLGGGLSAWNQPIEVIRVEMQSKTQDPNRPKNLTVGKTFKYIYDSNGLKGLYRGVAPRIGLGIWQTVCMVALGDMAKEAVEKLTGETVTAKH